MSIIEEIEALKVDLQKDREIEMKINSVIIPIVKSFICSIPDDLDNDEISNLFGQYKIDLSMNIIDILRTFSVLKTNLSLRLIRLHIKQNKGIYVDYSIIDNDTDNDRLFSVEIV